MEWTQLEWRQTLAVLVLNYWAFIDIAVSSSLIVEVLGVCLFLNLLLSHTVRGIYSFPPYCKEGHPEPWGKGGSEDGGVVLWLDGLWAGYHLANSFLFCHCRFESFTTNINWWNRFRRPH